jgi:hypothetical protein
VTVATPKPAYGRVPPNWGQPLTKSDYAALAASWITPEIADAAMLRRVNAAEGRTIVGRKGQQDCAGLLISYYWPGENAPNTYRLRRDNPEFEAGKDGELKPVAKYLGAPGGGNRLYIPPRVTVAQLADPTIPIVLVEGEKKALALWRLANHEKDRPRFIPIAIAGVWNWRGKIGRTGGPSGGWLEVRGPIPDLARIEWKERIVFILFDADVHSNENVKWARKGLARELASRAAEVKFVNLPENCGASGVDDLLVKWGPTRVLELFDAAVTGTRVHVVLSPQFQSTPEGMFRVSSGSGKLSKVQLTNYQAAVAKNIILDDGIETKREFDITAEMLGRTSRFTISASEFVNMNWAVERLGVAAITYPNQREYARAAIQSLSLTAIEECIYTHTGWRLMGEHRVFLHSAGAIGAGGVLADVRVRLTSTLSRYDLRLAASDGVAAAVRASLKLLKLGPPMISFPLLATTYRAVLGDSDFAVHLAGQTGAFKSEAAALHQQHFGVGMTRKNLPAGWASTANSLEVLAFHAKDVLLTVDDFAPQGNAAEVARYHAAADRLFRAIGNHAARGRLDATAKMKETRPPRALVLSTGEEIPRGQSVRARLFILELAKGAIAASNLTLCQRDAADGLYTAAMGSYIQWLAPRYDAAYAALERSVAEYRLSAMAHAAHARTPDIIANLQAGFDLFLEFAVEVGALGTAQRTELAEECWDALLAAAAVQNKHQGESEPAARFVAALRSLLTSGRVHLAARNGGAPCRPESCGWKGDSASGLTPLGDCIGWIDGDHLYLDPTAAYRAVQIAGRDIGNALPVSESTLNKRLHERGFLHSVDARRETLTVRRSIGGVSVPVLHFLRGTLLPEVSDGDEDAE